MIRSPIHFTGNKKKALQNGLADIVSTPDGRFFDMMVGGGSVLYNSNPVSPVGLDFDARLICLHRHFLDELLVQAVWEVLNKYNDVQTEEDYYALRDEFNQIDRFGRVDLKWAARLIVLTQTSFNSLWRFSKNGYNVPYGHGLKQPDLSRVQHSVEHCRKISPLFVAEDVLTMDMGLLRSFRSGARDKFYFDPPYLQSAYKYTGWDSEKESLLRSRILSLASDSMVVLSNVAFYRGEINTDLLDWAEASGFFIYVIKNVNYRSWASAVKSAGGSKRTIEIVITNFQSPELNELDRSVIDECE
jgi:site-specific DNA-adenine methylase